MVAPHLSLLAVDSKLIWSHQVILDFLDVQLTALEGSCQKSAFAKDFLVHLGIHACKLDSRAVVITRIPITLQGSTQFARIPMLQCRFALAMSICNT